MKEYMNLSQGQLDEAFMKACLDGNLPAVEYLLTSPELPLHANIHAKQNFGEKDDGFVNACKGGHLEVVRFLLTSPKLKEKVDIHTRNDDGFIDACGSGNSQLVKFLLTSNELAEHAYIDSKNNMAIKNACSKGCVEVVDYLLNFEQPKRFHGLHSLGAHALKKLVNCFMPPDKQYFSKGVVDIHSGNDFCFIVAAQEGHLEMMKYLLLSPTMKKHGAVDMHAGDTWHSNDAALMYACQNNHAEIVRFLTLSPEMKEHCEVSSNNYRVLRYAMAIKDFGLFKELILSPSMVGDTNMANKALEYALETNLVEFTQFLLTSEELTKNSIQNPLLSSLDGYSNSATVVMCKLAASNKLDIIQYLLSASHLPEYEIIKNSCIDMFKTAMEKQSYDVVSYLIMTLEPEYTPGLSQVINEHPVLEETKILFEKRLLNETLERGLATSSFRARPNKV